MPSPPHLEQRGHHGDVTKNDEGDDDHVEEGEDDGVGHVPGALAVEVEEAPRPRELQLVAAEAHEGPGAEEEGEDHGGHHDPFGDAVGEAAMVEVREPEG